MTIDEFLKLARSRAIMDEKTFRRLGQFHAELQAKASRSADGSAFTLDAPKEFSEDDAPDLSEAPRFLRGFHDVLITIGIVVFLLGLGTLTNFLILIPVIILLAEWFVLRQRLALPAFTLTIMLALVVGIFSTAFDDLESLASLAMRFGWQFAALGLFYWRYRVPVALALMLTTLGCFVYFVVIASLGGEASSLGATLEENARLYGAIGLVFALAFFALAMWFDLGDRFRVTRRSDVAFWLHLATAPALLYAMFATLLGSEGFVFSDGKTLEQSLAVIGIVILLMLVGIIIDRRAFVTAGLISLGVAFYIISKELEIGISSIGAFSAVGVGAVVLLLGSGWQSLRRFFLAGLPPSVRDRLPPL